MKSYRKLLILLLLITIYNCKTKDTYDYKKLLENEFYGIFFKEEKVFVTDEDFNELRKIKDNEKYLEHLLFLLKKKDVQSNFNFGVYEDAKYTFDIDSIFVRKKIKKNTKKIFEYYLKIHNECNKELNLAHIISLTSGEYKIFYEAINKYLKNYDNPDVDLINEFIVNLPDPKLCVLGDYMFFQYYGDVEKLNEKRIYGIYKNIDKDNYEKLIKKTKLYKLVTKEYYNTVLKNFGYYYKLVEKNDKP